MRVKACHGSNADPGPDRVTSEFRFKVIRGELPPWFSIGLVKRQPMPGRVPDIGVHVSWQWRPQLGDGEDAT